MIAAYLYLTQANDIYLSYNVFYYYYLTCMNLDWYNRCRWCPNAEEHLVYVKYDLWLLNILDAQKGVLTLKNPIPLEEWTYGKLNNICFYISLLNLVFYLKLPIIHLLY